MGDGHLKGCGNGNAKPQRVPTITNKGGKSNNNNTKQRWATFKQLNKYYTNKKMETKKNANRGSSPQKD